MELRNFIRPLGRVLNPDAAIRFTLDDEELDVLVLEYIIRDAAWYVRLRKMPKKGTAATTLASTEEPKKGHGDALPADEH